MYFARCVLAGQAEKIAKQKLAYIFGEIFVLLDFFS